jgi:hypothetical protein
LEGWPHKRGLTELWKGGIVRGGYCIVGGVVFTRGRLLYFGRVAS